ncbi:hypothetical protein UFOVP1022_26 [uncultured Caudovirales phage]|uniref:Uncharacterized protein n=3 Tax=uncultured Caudovirales phage TaxID=2100421 RepID=A0A6J5SKK2_9CAUD|nr:hypothetical protein UFOVP1022_26 [uncultured Caudovirales phage]CAB4183851.1 hypothetical protein UFOVP1110_15 [uncultured Caudovirales phage]CAB4202447.1 hypothetical protein UFOVP1378_17 [uncultured Caudovirales phage]CAB4215299.1 hypothetical protein UFOVP1474_12 [uncultured Caudovirales phage]
MTANELADELDLRRNLLMGKEHELGARAILLYGHSADMLCEQQAEIEALKLRELSDEEITKLWAESHEDGIAMQQGFTTQQHYFAHLLLKKTSEK